MEAGDWTWLETARLAVGVLTPIIVVCLGIFVARAARRLEQAQWSNQKLIEHRLDLFNDMKAPLNDLYCFFRAVGTFRDITPPQAIARKRELDKLHHTNRPLMSEEFATRYAAFMDCCFLTYTGVGRDARLRASVTRQRSERAGQWEPGWDDCFVVQESAVTGLGRIGETYRDLMHSFATEVGVR